MISANDYIVQGKQIIFEIDLCILWYTFMNKLKNNKSGFTITVLATDFRKFEIIFNSA